MKRIAAIFLALAASASVAAQQSAFDDRLEAVRAEAQAAQEAAAALQRDAAASRNEAERLGLEAQARAEQIAAAEARLSETLIELQSLRSARAQIEERLTAERRPLAFLTAGLATLSRQPPLASIADARSTDELVRLQLLIGASIPAIEQRTAALETDLADLTRLDEAARLAQVELEDRREALAIERERFAEAEARQRASLAAIEAAAFDADRRGIAVREDLAELEDESTRRAKAEAEARALATYPAPPIAARKGGAVDELPPFSYRLPADARVVAGFGSISEDGIRARGLTLATRRGTAVVAPADGRIGYVGPFRGRDGVMVIDHGGGWLSLLTGVRSRLAEGDTVEQGATLGRTIGPLGVELWQEGRPRSPALIAGSSDSL